MTHDIDEPAIPSPAVSDPVGGEPHSHPLPKSLRIIGVVYGLLLGLTLGAIVVGGLELIHGADDRREQQIASVKHEVNAELDRRTKARNGEMARQDADARETRRLVDDLAVEVARLRALGERAGLDTSTVPRTRPRAIARPSPNSAATSPSPAASAPPPPPRSPSPSPSPSPSCRPVRRLLGQC